MKPRYVTDQDWEAYKTLGGRYQLYRLCPCDACNGRGKTTVYTSGHQSAVEERCDLCRGEGRTHQLIANAETPEAVGVALITLAREGEFAECPIGILDTEGEPGQRWLVKPWMPSARNVSDAARTLAQRRHQ